MIDYSSSIKSIQQYAELAVDMGMYDEATIIIEWLDDLEGDPDIENNGDFEPDNRQCRKAPCDRTHEFAPPKTLF
jgi:hypothetical protein